MKLFPWKYCICSNRKKASKTLKLSLEIQNNKENELILFILFHLISWH